MFLAEICLVQWITRDGGLICWRGTCTFRRLRSAAQQRQAHQAELPGLLPRLILTRNANKDDFEATQFSVQPFTITFLISYTTWIP